MLIGFLVILLLFSCETGDINPVIPSAGTFQLHDFENLFFTKDNGIILAGLFKNKITLIKTSPDFKIVWSKNNYDWGQNTSTGSGWGSSFYSVQITRIFQQNNGNYICIASVLEGGDVVYKSTLIIELNSKGEQTKKLLLKNTDASNALYLNDGGILLFGTSLVKINKNYQQIWSKKIYDNDFYAYQIIATSDGGFATTGTYKMDKVFLKLYDSNGNELSSNIYTHNNSPIDEAGYDLTQLNDKGFLIVGRTTKSNVLYNIDCQLIRTTDSGDTIWTKRFGDSTNDWLDRIVSNNENELVIQGTSGFPMENPRSIIIKINKDGTILDSIKTENIPLIVFTPLKYYIKVQKTDSDHISLSSMDITKLF